MVCGWVVQPLRTTVLAALAQRVVDGAGIGEFPHQRGARLAVDALEAHMQADVPVADAVGRIALKWRPQPSPDRAVLLSSGRAPRREHRRRRIAKRVTALPHRGDPVLAALREQFLDHLLADEAAPQRIGSQRDETAAASTQDLANDKSRGLRDLVDPHAGLSTLSYHLDVDLGAHPLDAALPNIDVPGVQGHYQEVREATSRDGLTLRDLGKRYGSRYEGDFVGTPGRVADGMERWFREGACDGFTVSVPYQPGGFEDFVRLVVPELQRRGLFRSEYEGASLRDNLGLQRPASGAWQARAPQAKIRETVRNILETVRSRGGFCAGSQPSKQGEIEESAPWGGRSGSPPRG